MIKINKSETSSLDMRFASNLRPHLASLKCDKLGQVSVKKCCIDNNWPDEIKNCIKMAAFHHQLYTDSC